MQKEEPRQQISRLARSTPLSTARACVCMLVSVVLGLQNSVLGKVKRSSNLRNIMLIAVLITCLSTVTGNDDECDAQLMYLSKECVLNKWNQSEHRLPSMVSSQCCRAVFLTVVPDTGKQACFCEQANDTRILGFQFGRKEIFELLLLCGLPPEVNCNSLSTPPTVPSTANSKLDVIVCILSGISALIGIVMWALGCFRWLWEKCKVLLDNIMAQTQGQSDASVENQAEGSADDQLAAIIASEEMKNNASATEGMGPFH